MCDFLHLVFTLLCHFGSLWKFSLTELVCIHRSTLLSAKDISVYLFHFFLTRPNLLASNFSMLSYFSLCGKTQLFPVFATEKLSGRKLNVAEVTQSEIGQKQKLQTVLEAVNDVLRPHGWTVEWSVDCEFLCWLQWYAWITELLRNIENIWSIRGWYIWNFHHLSSDVHFLTKIFQLHPS